MNDEFDLQCTPISPPIYLTSTFEGGGRYSYSRCDNPTRSMLESELASLEGGDFAFAFSSGLAAVNAVFALLKKGDRVIVSDDIYGGTYRLISELYSHYGISFEFVDMTDKGLVTKALSRPARMIFCETPTNPMMKIADIRYLSHLSHSAGAILCVDNTFLTPYFQNPLSLGADIVLHSATKFLSGHHDVTAGALITGDRELAERLSLISRTHGSALDPFSAWLVMRGLRTLGMRMERHQKNAVKVAEFLSSHPKIDRVLYPALVTHPQHILCSTQARGYGGVVTFSLKSSDRVDAFLTKNGIIRYAESLGGFCTLVTHPATQTHASTPAHIRTRLGITQSLLRLSVGLEDADEIIASLERALE